MENQLLDGTSYYGIKTDFGVTDGIAHSYNPQLICKKVDAIALHPPKLGIDRSVILWYNNFIESCSF